MTQFIPGCMVTTIENATPLRLSNGLIEASYSKSNKGKIKKTVYSLEIKLDKANATNFQKAEQDLLKDMGACRIRFKAIRITPHYIEKYYKSSLQEQASSSDSTLRIKAEILSTTSTALIDNFKIGETLGNFEITPKYVYILNNDEHRNEMGNLGISWHLKLSNN